jgi:hypothetical protein
MNVEVQARKGIFKWRSVTRMHGSSQIRERPPKGGMYYITIYLPHDTLNTGWVSDQADNADNVDKLFT